MEPARALLIVVAVLAARTAAALGPACEEGRSRTGVALVALEERLEVGAVDADSAAGASGIRVGDRVLQVNGVVPRSCADYSRAVREAEREGKALLLLVGRDAAEVPLALSARTWERPVAAVPPPPVREAPSVQAVVTKPLAAPLPAATQVSLAQVLQGLEKLTVVEAPSARLSAYQHDLLRLHREVETLAARQSVPPSVSDGLRTVLRYHDAAEVAWAAEETQRERERLPRHLPTNESAAVPFFADSDVTATIEEFPFLREAVSRDPHPGLVGETSGLWRPLQARTLIWTHARDELSKLRTWLDPSASSR